MEVKASQSQNTPSTIYFNCDPFSKVTLLKEEQFENRSSSRVTLLGILILVKLTQEPNACLPISVTSLGILILIRLLHLLNALSPISVTLSGISIFFKLLQRRYLQPIITQYFIDNKSEIWLLFLIAHSKR